MALNKERNLSVDVIRGIAMLLVVLGHTIAGSTVNYEKNIVYEIIWSLQMPLFMMISGYVMKYSRNANNAKELLVTVFRKLIAYILPWLVWTMVVRGLIFGHHAYLNIVKLFYNMDQGYWFLFSLFTISVIFVVSDFFSAKIAKERKNVLYVALITLLFAIGAAILLVIGIFMGMNFLCIKLTLYYSPFFFAGFLYGKLQDWIFSFKHTRFIFDFIGLVSFALWLAILNFTDYYLLKEDVFGIAIRAIGSLAGCIAVCNLVVKIPCNRVKLISYAGRHSLEIYLAHYLVLNLFMTENLLNLASVPGVGIVCLNFLIAIVVSFAVAWALHKNTVAKVALLGKIKF